MMIVVVGAGLNMMIQVVMWPRLSMVVIVVTMRGRVRHDIRFRHRKRNRNHEWWGRRTRTWTWAWTRNRHRNDIGTWTRGRRLGSHPDLAPSKQQRQA